MSLSDSREDVIWGHNFFVIILALFVMGFMFVIGYVLLSNMVAGFAASGHYSATAAQMSNNYLAAQRVWDYAIVVVMVAMMVALMITSYRILASPVYFVATLVMGGFYGLAGYIFSYMFQEIMKQPALSAAIAYFPRTILLCTNLHWVGLASLVVGSIALYAKRQKGEVETLE